MSERSITYAEPVFFKTGLLACYAIFLLVLPCLAQKLPKDTMGKLASDEFEVREKAYQELIKWSKTNLKTSPETIYQTWKATKDPEVKSRCFSVMKEAVILREFGRGPGFLGVRMDDFLLRDEKQEGAVIKAVRIVFVMQNTPAEKFGLHVGDMVLGVDELIFNEAKDIHPRGDAVNMLSQYIQSKHPDDVITLRLLRGGKKIDKKVTLMLRPDDLDRDPFGGDRRGDRQYRRELFFKRWMEKMAG